MNGIQSWDYTTPLLNSDAQVSGNPLSTDGVPTGGGNAYGSNSYGGGQQQLKMEHPLLPMPGIISNNNGVNHYNPVAVNPYMRYPGASMPHQIGGPYGNGNLASAQSMANMSGYPMQAMDMRPAVVQVSHFPDQVCLWLFLETLARR